MLATAGILFTSVAGLPQWYEAGQKAMAGAIHPQRSIRLILVICAVPQVNQTFLGAFHKP